MPAPTIITVDIKISKTIGTLYTLSHFVLSSCSCEHLQCTRSTEAPYLTYGLISLGNAFETYLDKIFILQKRALRLIYSINRHLTSCIMNPC